MTMPASSCPEYIETGILADDPFVSIDEDGIGALMAHRRREGPSANARTSRPGSAASTEGDPKSVALLRRHRTRLRLLLPVPCADRAARRGPGARSPRRRAPGSVRGRPMRVARPVRAQPLATASSCAPGAGPSGPLPLGPRGEPPVPIPAVSWSPRTPALIDFQRRAMASTCGSPTGASTRSRPSTTSSCASHFQTAEISSSTTTRIWRTSSNAAHFEKSRPSAPSGGVRLPVRGRAPRARPGALRRLRTTGPLRWGSTRAPARSTAGSGWTAPGGSSTGQAVGDAAPSPARGRSTEGAPAARDRTRRSQAPDAPSGASDCGGPIRRTVYGPAPPASRTRAAGVRRALRLLVRWCAILGLPSNGALRARSSHASAKPFLLRGGGSASSFGEPAGLVNDRPSQNGNLSVWLCRRSCPTSGASRHRHFAFPMELHSGT